MPATADRALTAVRFHILLALARKPQHGYAVKREVEERTRGAVRLGAGTLYAAVSRLHEDRLIETVDPPPDAESAAGSRWRFYALTAAGRTALEQELQRLERDVRSARRLLHGSASRRGAQR